MNLPSEARSSAQLKPKQPIYLCRNFCFLVHHAWGRSVSGSHSSSMSGDIPAASFDSSLTASSVVSCSTSSSMASSMIAFSMYTPPFSGVPLRCKQWVMILRDVITSSSADADAACCSSSAGGGTNFSDWKGATSAAPQGGPWAS